uniref:FZ domain-containing protein n=1 Tax=Alexandrium catenella TaxID=2925 RepID=A0A7S1SD02_ALECA
MHFLVVFVQLLSCLVFAEASQVQHYSTNAICRQNNCINPIFPGLTDLSMLEASSWQCQSHSKVRKYMQFCEPVVNYNVAVPSPNKSMPLSALVEAQEKAAVTMYFYALSGMNMEPQEFKHPEQSGDQCVQAVWTMVCNTYFPKAEAGCQDGQGSNYLRPCKNVCGAYLQACDVRCCDEGTRCVFDQQVSLAEGGTVQLTGYSDNLGPSAYCTGGTNWDNNSGAPRAAGTLGPGALLAGLLALVLPLARDGPATPEHRSGSQGSRL